MPCARSTSKPKRYPCTYEGCKSSYPRPSKLANHMKQHEGQKPFKCDINDCDKGYTTRAHLKRHQETHNNSVHEKVNCTIPECDKTFSNISNMQRHIKRAHNPNKVPTYTCKECMQGFNKKRLLHQHMYLHTGEYSYTCNICQKGFHTLDDYHRHYNTHAVYQCQDCTESFTKWSDMRKHRVMHRPLLKCNDCNYKTQSKGAFRKHKRIHISADDRTKFSCNFKDCTREYYYKNNLKSHIRSFHFGIKKRISCPIKGCVTTLSKKHCLRVHLRTKHNSPSTKSFKPRRIRKDCGIPRKNPIASLVAVDNQITLKDIKVDNKPTSDFNLKLNDELPIII